MNVSQADAGQTLQAANPHTFRLGAKLPSRAIPSPFSGSRSLHARNQNNCAGNDGTYLYNTYTGQWKQGAPRPYPGHHHAAEVINNKLFIFGGLRVGGNKVGVWELR